MDEWVDGWVGKTMETQRKGNYSIIEAKNIIVEWN